MRYETIPLPVPGAKQPTILTAYIPDNPPELGAHRKRTALIICPGGGYNHLSAREGEPVALRFAGLGYAAFVLAYQVEPVSRWPVPQRQLFAAIDHVRRHADVYQVRAEAVIAMGFSAGGHVAASAGTLWTNSEIIRPLHRPPAQLRPDGLVLCYPVITTGAMAHQPSIQNLLGSRYAELKYTASLERQVRRRTPPAFLWHTADDTAVPVENTLLFAAAMEAKGVPAEVHIYPHGRHGQSLADPSVYPPEKRWEISVSCAGWVEQCDLWLLRHFENVPSPPAGE